MTFFWFVFGAAFGVLVVLASIALHRRRRAWRADTGPRLDDAMIARIIEEGALVLDDEPPLDLGEIHEEERRFWSETWDEPTEEW